MLLTLPIREVVPATPRAHVVRIDLNGENFSYLPGQAVFVASHDHERRRPYSLATAPEEAARDNYLELLVGMNSQGTAGPHLALDRGSLVDVEGPVGHFVLPSELDVARFLFIAGGTGIAPLRAMMNRVLRGPYSSIGVFYSARTVSDFAYEDELRQLAQSGRIELKQTVTREVGEDWGGVRGRISSSELARLVHDLETLCFLCGPPALVQDMPKLLAEIGVPPGRIRIEEWSQRSPA